MGNALFGMAAKLIYTSGDWNLRAITSMAHNPLLLVIFSYGRCSILLRFTANGPRTPTDQDVPVDGNPKV